MKREKNDCQLATDEVILESSVIVCFDGIRVHFTFFLILGSMFFAPNSINLEIVSS